MSTPERKLEQQLVAYCKTRGLYCRKFVSPGHAGVPDRLVIGPRCMLFIELKSPGKKPTPIQEREMKLINRSADFVSAITSSDWPSLKLFMDYCV